ncbi:MAG TPA: 3-oxoacyl-[acyl-carrier-protein] synthase III C-terminal domain-containing protein [Gemmataceae bacterium]|nr:3-oxoacyl-[acyl-carrier-protein] synthase III C-terminal domain-containing protein [Gemmataceae bacterium]
MNAPERAAVVGVGYFVPPIIRTNDDPIFSWLKQHQAPGQDLFRGYRERRILACPDSLCDLPKTLADLMVPAANQAMRSAGVGPSEIDVLLGDASVSEYYTPNALADIHRRLRLPASTWIVPINLMANFNTSLLVADSLVKTGRCRNALIVCGCNWTRYVSYRTPQSISAADGAGAAVVARTTGSAAFAVVDAETIAETADYGSMYLAGDPNRTADGICFSPPYYHITNAGLTDFQTFGEKSPPEAVHRLLRRNGVEASQVCLISHQASRVLLDAWRDAIRPGQYLETLEQFANMVAANVPVNLAYHLDRIEKNNLVLLAVGPEFMASAVLLRRGV